MIALTITASADQAATVERLAAVELYAVGGANVGEMTDGCTLLDVRQEGRIVGALAIDRQGDLATITACQFEGEYPVAAFAALESLLRQNGIKRIKAETTRPGMVRRLAGACGYDLVRAELIKEI